MTKKRINGRLARSYVQTRTEFKNSNGQLYGEWRTVNGHSHYTVYSYGMHWPLFIWVREVKTWFENKDKFSPTTSKHRSYTHPYPPTIVPLSCDNMRALDVRGYGEFIMDRLVGERDG